MAAARQRPGRMARAPGADRVPWGGMGADRSRREKPGGRDAPLAARLPRRLLRLRGPGDDTQFGTQRIGQRHDEREFRPHPAGREQVAAHAGGVLIDPPRQLSLGDAQVNPERVKLPDHRIGLGDLPRRPLIRRPVLRVLHPPLPATLMHAHVEHPARSRLFLPVLRRRHVHCTSCATLRIDRHSAGPGHARPTFQEHLPCARRRK